MTAILSVLFWPLHKAVGLFDYDTYYKAADELWLRTSSSRKGKP
ncbi:hypothetical protein [Mycobacterium sp. 23]